ncbi:hypothetical protein [Streptomyces sp. NPDC096153]|uniref:hypothetical protein n=1 Tax=Streptomyces sp. NPDC096153 TaxID=3155548 RepID=UPI00331F9E1D
MLTRGNAAVERLVQGKGLHEALGAANPDAWLELDAELRVVRPHTPVSRSRADPADPGMPDWAPLGPAECGEPADSALLWPLTTRLTPSVRARAVAGLHLLGRADVERLRPLLDDPTPAVVREAATTLLPWADLLPEDRLLRRLTDRRKPAHTRRAAFRLLRARGGSRNCGQPWHCSTTGTPRSGPSRNPRSGSGSRRWEETTTRPRWKHCWTAAGISSVSTCCCASGGGRDCPTGPGRTGMRERQGKRGLQGGR